MASFPQARFQRAGAVYFYLVLACLSSPILPSKALASDVLNVNPGDPITVTTINEGLIPGDGSDRIEVPPDPPIGLLNVETLNISAAAFL